MNQNNNLTTATMTMAPGYQTINIASHPSSGVIGMACTTNETPKNNTTTTSNDNNAKLADANVSTHFATEEEVKAKLSSLAFSVENGKIILDSDSLISGDPSIETENHCWTAILKCIMKVGVNSTVYSAMHSLRYNQPIHISIINKMPALAIMFDTEHRRSLSDLRDLFKTLIGKDFNIDIFKCDRLYLKKIGPGKVHLEMVRVVPVGFPDNNHYITIYDLLTADLNTLRLPIDFDYLYKAAADKNDLVMTQIFDILRNGEQIFSAISENDSMGHTNKILEKLAHDLQVPVAAIETGEINAQLKETLARVATLAVKPRDTRVEQLPNDCSDEIVDQLIKDHGSFKFVRGVAGSHPHPYHNASRHAITRTIISRYPKSDVLYDIGGNFYYHAQNGDWHVHSVFKTEKHEDASRYQTYTKSLVKYATNKISNKNISGSLNSVSNSMLTQCLTKTNNLWCNNSWDGCPHGPNSSASFAMSIDTLFNIEPAELLAGYIDHKVLTATHALTIPAAWHSADSGSMKFGEGYWQKIGGQLIVTFPGESLVYTNPIRLIELYMNTPILMNDTHAIYCRVSGYTGPHLIIEHFVLPRTKVLSKIVQHSLWTNPDIDSISVVVPHIDIYAPVSLLRREPFTLEPMMLNIKFYEKLLNRLLLPHTWEALLQYAAGLVGRTYGSASGFTTQYNLTNSEVKRHCLVAYWSNNRGLESLKPLIKRSEELVHQPSFLQQMWSSLKTFLMELGREFDPTDNAIFNKFLTDNSQDNMHVSLLLDRAFKTIDTVSESTRLRLSHTITNGQAMELQVNSKLPAPDVDTWREEHTTLNHLTVNNLLKTIEEVNRSENIGCVISARCKHNHKMAHVHKHGDFNVQNIGECVCCGVISTVDFTSHCSLCAEHDLCLGKSISCKHAHTFKNDECCGYKNCNCKKTLKCSCCGMPSEQIRCKICGPETRTIIPQTAKKDNDDTNYNINSSGVSEDAEFWNDEDHEAKPTDTKEPSDQNQRNTGANTTQFPPFQPQRSASVPNLKILPTNSMMLANVEYYPSKAAHYTYYWPNKAEHGVSEHSKHHATVESLASDYNSEGYDSGNSDNDSYRAESVVTDANVTQDLSARAENKIMAKEMLSELRDLYVDDEAPIDALGFKPGERMSSLYTPLTFYPGAKDREPRSTYVPINLSQRQNVVTVWVESYGQAIGDGTCAADALAQVSSQDYKYICELLQLLTGNTEWWSDVELAIAAAALRINLCVATPAGSILYINDTNMSTYVSICTLVQETGDSHWVPCTALIDQVYARDVNQKYMNFLFLATYSTMRETGTVDVNEIQKAVNECHSIGLQAAINVSFHIDNDWMNILKTCPGGIFTQEGYQHTSQPFISHDINTYIHKENDLTIVSAPTGFGKTTKAAKFGKPHEKHLVISPNRVTVINAASYCTDILKITASARANSQWYPLDLPLKLINDCQVVYMTVDSLYAVISNGITNDWKQLLSGRKIWLDEIHDVTPNYMYVAKQLGSYVTGVMSATIHGKPVITETKHSVVTTFCSQEVLSNLYADYLEQGPTREQAWIVPNVAGTYELPTESIVKYNQSEGRFASVSSKTAPEVNWQVVNSVIATNCITTGATMPHIKHISDLGIRITSHFHYPPIIGMKKDVKTIKFYTYSRYNYSMSDLMQSRGRAGRTDTGTAIMALPSDEQQLPPHVSLLYALKNQLAVPTSAKPLCDSLIKLPFNEQAFDAEFNENKDKIDSKIQQWDSYLTWKEDLLEFKKLLQTTKVHYSDVTYTKEDMQTMLVQSLSNKPIVTLHGAKHDRAQHTIASTKIRLPKLAKCVCGATSLVHNPSCGLPYITNATELEWLDRAYSKYDGSMFSHDETIIAIDTSPSSANIDIRFKLAQQYFNIYSKMLNTILINAKNASQPSLPIGPKHGVIFTSAKKNNDYAVKNIQHPNKVQNNSVVGIFDRDNRTLTLARVNNGIINVRLSGVNAVIITPIFTANYALLLAYECLQKELTLSNTSQVANQSIIISGPAGSGKTRLLAGRYHTDPKSKILVTKQLDVQFDYNISPVSPNKLLQMRQDYETIYIDEGGLMTASDYILLASKCKKMVISGDLAQKVADDVDLETSVSLDNTWFTSQVHNKIELTETYRFGNATREFLAPIGFNYVCHNTKDKGIFMKQCNWFNKKTFNDNLLEFDIQLVITHSNAMASNIREFLGPNSPIKCMTTGRAQGSQASRTLYVAVNNPSVTYTIPEVYTALTRHKEHCVILCDSTAFNTLKSMGLYSHQAEQQSLRYGYKLDQLLDSSCTTISSVVNVNLMANNKITTVYNDVKATLTNLYKDMLMKIDEYILRPQANYSLMLLNVIMDFNGIISSDQAEKVCRNESDSVIYHEMYKIIAQDGVGSVCTIDTYTELCELLATVTKEGQLLLVVQNTIDSMGTPRLLTAVVDIHKKRVLIRDHYHAHMDQANAASLIEFINQGVSIGAWDEQMVLVGHENTSYLQEYLDKANKIFKRSKQFQVYNTMVRSCVKLLQSISDTKFVGVKSFKIIYNILQHNVLESNEDIEQLTGYEFFRDYIKTIATARATVTLLMGLLDRSNSYDNISSVLPTFYSDTVVEERYNVNSLTHMLKRQSQQRHGAIVIDQSLIINLINALMLDKLGLDVVAAGLIGATEFTITTVNDYLQASLPVHVIDYYLEQARDKIQDRQIALGTHDYSQEAGKWDGIAAANTIKDYVTSVSKINPYEDWSFFNVNIPEAKADNLSSRHGKMTTQLINELLKSAKKIGLNDTSLAILSALRSVLEMSGLNGTMQKLIYSIMNFFSQLGASAKRFFEFDSIIEDHQYKIEELQAENAILRRAMEEKEDDQPFYDARDYTIKLDHNGDDHSIDDVPVVSTGPFEHEKATLHSKAVDMQYAREDFKREPQDKARENSGLTKHIKMLMANGKMNYAENAFNVKGQSISTSLKYEDRHDYKSGMLKTWQHHEHYSTLKHIGIPEVWISQFGSNIYIAVDAVALKLEWQTSNSYKLCWHDESALANESMLSFVLKTLSTLGGAKGPQQNTLIKTIVTILKQLLQWCSLIKDEMVWNTKYYSGAIPREQRNYPVPVEEIWRYLQDNTKFMRMLTIRKGARSRMVMVGDRLHITRRVNAPILDCHTFAVCSPTQTGCRMTVYSATDYRIKLMYKTMGLNSVNLDDIEDLRAGKAGLDGLRRLGINIDASHLETDDFNSWKTILHKALNANPLTALFDMTLDDVYTSYKKLVEQENDLLELSKTINKYAYSIGTNVGVCIPSGHGKTTTVNLMRKKYHNFNIIDADECVTDITVLQSYNYERVMQGYASDISKNLPNNNKPTILFCHDTQCVPDNYKTIIIFNKQTPYTPERLWKSENEGSLKSKTHLYPTFHLNFDEIELTVLHMAMTSRVPSIKLSAKSEIIDPMPSEEAYQFFTDPGADLLYYMPQDGNVAFRDHNHGISQQRIYKQGPHVGLCRPAVQMLANATFNAVSTRVKGVQKLRTNDFNDKEYLAKMSHWFKPGWENKLKEYQEEVITPSVNAALEWAINKGHKVELMRDMVESVMDYEQAVEYTNVQAHFKTENLLKENVGELEHQIGRIIIWHNQNLNMIMCPMINECKKRLVLLFDERKITYSDGMDMVQLNSLLSKIKPTKYLVELDLSKQDRQTDKQILHYEHWMLEKLGLDGRVCSYMNSLLGGFSIKTPDGVNTKTPAIHMSGGAMTSLGNEMRNLLLLSDICQNKEINHVFTLGDDSLIMTNDEFDGKYVGLVAASNHNVSCTFNQSTTSGVFLQLIIAEVNGKYVATHNFKRLREKLAYSPYGSHTDEYKSKVASYLLMVGESPYTVTRMQQLGFDSFVPMGTTFEERLQANAIHHNTDGAEIVNTINDLVVLSYGKHQEILTIQGVGVIRYKHLKAGFHAAGERVSDQTLLAKFQHAMQQYNENN
ncbi:polyprotein [Sclerotinia sclerotiorum endornavirus 11]|nr:polyprotein [Sclerotinia sclerotiorum endornavirus 11]